MRTLLLATSNRHKLAEIRELLKDVQFELTTLADYPPVEAPEETGRTFVDNARLKALYYAARTGQLVVAEDSGLEIEALDGAPGVESARFGGIGTPYPEKFVLIYRALRERNATGSRARFVSALALASNDAILFERCGIVEGRVAAEPAAGGGFGYDPIFFYPPFGCTFAEAGDAKSAVSHRAEAFRALRAFLMASR
jgi:XTP/dITP diphosphohydrolase